MEDRGISTDDVLKALQDIRLPADASGGVVAELLAAFGLGLLLAWCLTFFLSLATGQSTGLKPGHTKPAELESDAGSDEDRTVILLHELRRVAPGEAKRLARDIYAPGGTPDPETVRAALNRAERADA